MHEQNVKRPTFGQIVSVMLLIGGTCIGGGMLALPVATGRAGFMPSLAVMLVCWAFMTTTGLLILEINLRMPAGSHVITMASRMLGPIGKVVAWVIYLFVCYASLVAYTAAGGDWLVATLHASLGFNVAKGVACTGFAVFFCLFIYLGHKIVGRVNSILFFGMCGAFVALIGLGSSHVQWSLLARHNWDPKLSLMAIPLMLTAFSYQYIVPSLTPMLKSHGNWLRFSIVGGTSIALIIYIVWQWLVLGVVPLGGPHGLAHAYAHGQVATVPLHQTVGVGWLVRAADYFTVFALVTSFLGMSLGLFDFLADGLRIKKTLSGKALLGLLLVVPTVFFAANFARIFLGALDSSGGFGDAILNGIMPVMMVWIGRYHHQWDETCRVPGGKPLLILIMAFAVFALALECGSSFGLF